MKVYGRMTVFPIMPARINRLYELAYNLWWSWHPEARALYSTLDPDLWEEVGHNPVRFLSEVRPESLEVAANRADYLERYESSGRQPREFRGGAHQRRAHSFRLRLRQYQSPSDHWALAGQQPGLQVVQL